MLHSPDACCACFHLLALVLAPGQQRAVRLAWMAAGNCAEID